MTRPNNYAGGLHHFQDARDDPRIAYGMACSWWDSISRVGVIGPRGLPCCPYCRGLLFEHPDEATHWALVTAYAEKMQEPHYVEFIKWLRGKCFLSHDEAKAAFEQSGGGKVNV